MSFFENGRTTIEWLLLTDALLEPLLEMTTWTVDPAVGPGTCATTLEACTSFIDSDTDRAARRALLANFSFDESRFLIESSPNSA